MENSGTPRGNPAQHTLRTSVALHLLPGALVFAFYLAAAPSFIHRGVPPGLALLLGFLFVGIPLELGYLLYLGKRRNGALTLHGIVFFRERLPRWQYAGLFVLLFTIAFGALFLTSPATAFLATRLFA